jgi:hypothetical protein
VAASDPFLERLATDQFETLETFSAEDVSSRQKEVAEFLAATSSASTGFQQLSKFIHGYRGDFSNWWSLSEETLVTILRYHGFSEIEQVRRVTSAWIDDDEARALYVCRKP